MASAVTADALPLVPGVPRRYAKLLATAEYDVWL
ncbi:MAG: hypothetical protein QOF20_2754, partial [Acidimicrobiaceae bacterium]|nr:hypothetical protein [Acidimicrobiaceae bacterium]